MKNIKNIFIASWWWSEHKVCAYQTTQVYNFFKENSYNLLKSPKNADLIVLNGYPFEEFEEKITLLTVNYYLKTYRHAQILLIWSIPAMLPELSQVKRVQMLPLKGISNINTLFQKTVPIEDVYVDNLRYFLPLKIESLNIDSYGYEWKNIESKYVFTEYELSISVDKLNDGKYLPRGIDEYDSEKFNYLEDISWDYSLEICRGCWWTCSYCKIRNISGFVSSISIQDILKKLKRGLSLWYKKFHFIDEDSASYGLDRGVDFADLLNEINKIEWDFQMKILYFEPWRLQRLYHKIDKNVWSKITGFAVPLQTTSQRILKLMNRSYNIGNVLDIVRDIRNHNKDIIINTHFIYWFPTETFEEFKSYFQVMNLFDELRFWYYSDRKWTRSSFLNWKISKWGMIKRLLYLWKIKKKNLDKVFDKNETLLQWVRIFKKRDF